MQAQESDRVIETGPPRRSRPVLFAVLAFLVLGVLGIAIRELSNTAAPAKAPVQLGESTPETVKTPATNSAAGAVPKPVAPSDTATTPEGAPPTPLPALEHSDPEVRATLGDIVPPILQPSLAPDQLLQRAAALVSGFSRGKLLRDKLPLPALSGKFAVTQRGERIFMSEANFARYDVLVSAFAELDPDATGRWFDRYEPLLQQAYAELGDENRSVRTLLLAGIDSMLSAPDIQGEIELVQPAVFYKFADPALEGLPDAAKLMIRMGPANRSLMVQKLSRLRGVIARNP